MDRPRLILRSNKVWTIEVPVRGGGFAIPVHGVDDDGYALDPHDEVQPQRRYQAEVSAAIKAGKSLDEIMAIQRPWSEP